MAVNTLDRLLLARYNTFQWRCEASLVTKLALALGMACVTGLLAQIRIMLPWTPVPITGQTFAVLLAGVLLGKWWGGLSMVAYGGLGAAGVPWFIGWTGGVAHLAGPTGGYVIGFILAALFVGHFIDKYIRSGKLLSILGLMLFANFVLIYIPGLLQLHLWLTLIKGEASSFHQVVAIGLLQFIGGDVIKTIAAGGIGWAVTPKRAYNGESDRDK